MNKRQRRKLAKSLDCTYLKLDSGFSECKLKYWCFDESCKAYKFSRKELKRVLQNRSANRRMLKKAMKLNSHTIKSRAQLNLTNVGATVYKH